MQAFEHIRKLDALQPPYSLFRRETEQEILPYTRQHGIGVLVYGALAHGLLAATFTPQTTFAADDWRSKSPIFQGETFRRNLVVVEHLKRLAEREGMSVAQLAIAWVLAQGNDIVPIPGTKRVAYLDENLGALDVKLTAEDLRALDAIAPKGAFAGERYPASALASVNR